MKFWKRSNSCVGQREDRRATERRPAGSSWDGISAHHKPFKAANSRSDFCCSDCRRSFEDKDTMMAPMLHDRIWRGLAPRNETLCGVCMFKRAAEQRVWLTLDDLSPCFFNLQCAPFSWFEFFAANEPAPPKNLRQWEDALQQLSPRLLRWSREDRNVQEKPHAET
jgi:hypothetical protein